MNYVRRSVLCFMEQAVNLPHPCLIQSPFEWLLTLALRSLSRVDPSLRFKCSGPQTSRCSRSMNMQSAKSSNSANKARLGVSWRVLACLVVFQAMLINATGSREAARAARKASTAATPSNAALNSNVA